MIQCLETSNLPMIKYNFVTVAELQDIPKDSTTGERYDILCANRSHR